MYWRGLVGAVFGDEIEEGSYEGAVGVYDAEPVVVADVLDGEVLEEHGFSHACFADNVGVKEAVGGLDAEGLACGAE